MKRLISKYKNRKLFSQDSSGPSHNYEYWLNKVKENPWDIIKIPKEFQTSEAWLISIKKNAYVLQYTPSRLKTTEMCMEAVRQKGYALLYVPDKLKTPEMCLIAIKQNGSLKYVPDKFKTPEMCLMAVRQDGYSLQYVPDKFKTLEVCLTAIKQDPENIKFIPQNIQDQLFNKNSDIQNLKEKLKNFFKITMFKWIGSGFSASAYQINDSQILRISQDLPAPLPQDPYVNQRTGFTKIGPYYIEVFPMLVDVGQVSEEELEPIRKYLKQKYKAHNDLHKENFGRDIHTGEIKLLDPGCLPGVDIKKEDLQLVSMILRQSLNKILKNSRV